MNQPSSSISLYNKYIRPNGTGIVGMRRVCGPTENRCKEDGTPCVPPAPPPPPPLPAACDPKYLKGRGGHIFVVVFYLKFSVVFYRGIAFLTENVIPRQKTSYNVGLMCPDHLVLLFRTVNWQKYTGVPFCHFCDLDGQTWISCHKTV